MTQVLLDQTVQRLIGLALLGLFATACKPAIAVHQQDERSANRVVSLLAKEGIDAEKRRDEASQRELRFDVVVAAADLEPSLEILERHNLPETPKKDTCALLEGTKLIPTAEHERATRECGIAGNIVNNLRRVPRVVDVSALVSIPEHNPLRDPTLPTPRPKASVIVSYIGQEGLGPVLSKEIVKELVAPAVPDMTEDDVKVQLIATTTTSTTTTLPASACEKRGVLGIGVCAEHVEMLLNVLITSSLFAGTLAAMAVIATLRALRYRRDLTRLTPRNGRQTP